ncbi:hypothetical protein Ancab_036685 [Ancistrocladus abbreviatus]
MAARKLWKPVMLILCINFAFAIVNLLFKEVLNEGVNHLVIITYRQTASAIFLTPIACFKERKEAAKLTSRILCYLFLSALLGATLTQYLFLLGLQFTSVAFASAFVNLTPANTFLLALAFRLEKLNLSSKSGKAKMLGFFLCVGGVVLLALYRGFPINKPVHSEESINRAGDTGANASRKSTESYIIGAIFLTSGSLLWSSWFLIQARIGKRYPCRYSTTGIMCCFSAIQSAVLCLAIKGDISMWVLKGKIQILTAIFAGVVGSGLCYVGMAWCVEQSGPVFTAAFTPLIQIFAAILNLVFLHEEIYQGSILGSVVVVSGLYILLWGKSKEAEDNVVKPAEAVVDHQGSSSSTLCAIQVSRN